MKKNTPVGSPPSWLSDALDTPFPSLLNTDTSVNPNTAFGQIGDLFTRTHRSAKTFPDPLITSTPPLPTPPVTNMAIPPPIKILPQTHEVHPFTGEDSTYPIQQYLADCEDIIRNSGITEVSDKISFIRSHVKPGSYAMRRLNASAFRDDLQLNDFDAFKTALITVFSSGTLDSMSWVFRMINHLTSNMGKEDMSGALSFAGSVRTDADAGLKTASWYEPDGKNISIRKHLLVVEFLAFVFALSEQDRVKAARAKLKPDENLVTLFSRMTNDPMVAYAQPINL